MVEALPFDAELMHTTRSAHGSFADLLRELSQHHDYEVRTRALGLMRQYHIGSGGGGSGLHGPGARGRQWGGDRQQQVRLKRPGFLYWEQGGVCSVWGAGLAVHALSGVLIFCLSASKVRLCSAKLASGAGKGPFSCIPAQPLLGLTSDPLLCLRRAVGAGPKGG